MAAVGRRVAWFNSLKCTYMWYHLDKTTVGVTTLLTRMYSAAYCDPYLTMKLVKLMQLKEVIHPRGRGLLCNLLNHFNM